MLSCCCVKGPLHSSLPNCRKMRDYLHLVCAFLKCVLPSGAHNPSVPNHRSPGPGELGIGRLAGAAVNEAKLGCPIGGGRASAEVFGPRPASLDLTGDLTGDSSSERTNSATALPRLGLPDALHGEPGVARRSRAGAEARVGAEAREALASAAWAGSSSSSSSYISVALLIILPRPVAGAGAASPPLSPSSLTRAFPPDLAVGAEYPAAGPEDGAGKAQSCAGVGGVYCAPTRASSSARTRLLF